MGRQLAAVELNQFNAGLITDASPLTSPDNSSLAEENMVLNTDGSRNRRLGMDYEDDYNMVTTTIPSNTELLAHTSYTWKNAGGVAERSIGVIQFGNELKFFSFNSRPISNNLIHTEVFSTHTMNTRYSYATVDGFLVMVTPEEKQPYIFNYEEDGTITFTRQTIRIRDLFGLEASFNGTDLFSSTGLQIRPDFTYSTNEQEEYQRHLYNLRNQSWGIPRASTSGVGTSIDPISVFKNGNAGAGKYPSNSDTVVQALYADPSIPEGRTVERFFFRDLIVNPLGTTKAAQGYFIIDALERGVSRLAVMAENKVNYPVLEDDVFINFPQDITPGGPSVVAEFAGRVWYGGFSGEVIDGDNRSPRLSSYVMFSKLVNNPQNITECYQEGDPTSKDAPDIIDTDGGFIRLNDAYGIIKMENLGDSLIILCQNGVWRITGTSDNGFTATRYRVEKISDRGCVNQNTAVTVDNSIAYWSQDGIYTVRTNEVGDWVSTSITLNKIQRLYNDITEESRLSAVGAYDAQEKKIRWVYDNAINNTSETKEIVLDIVLQAFYINRILNIGSGGPKVLSIINTIPWALSTIEDDVVVGTELVTVNDEPVYIILTDRQDILRGELSYVVAITSGTNITFTFSNYTDNNFLDWKSFDGVGVDAEAYLITSYLSGTDFQRDKQVPYITVHMRRTEVGYDSDFNPLLPSECWMQVRWDWSSSARSGKWGREFQIYRYRKPYIPIDGEDDHDDGFSTIVSKNKLRGAGNVLSIRFRTGPGKDLHLYGWSMLFSTAENV